MGRVTSCTCHSESKLTERETEVLQFMLWSPKMDILATRPGGADLLRSGLRGGLTIRHIKTAASAALYSIQLDSEVVTASWPEIRDPHQ